MARSTEEPVVSIIVPVYKVEQYLHKCVDSIINQSYRKLEIILVDDGSPDRCPQICDEYKEKDDRIVVIHKPNGGLSDARNAGLNAATGDYITFIDSDDWYALDAIETLLRLIRKFKTPVACMSNIAVNAEGSIVETVKADREETVISSHELVKKICEKQYSTSVCNKLFQKDLWDIISFRKERLNEDFLALCELLIGDYSVAIIDYPGYFYYSRPESLTHQASSVINAVRDSMLNSLELKEKAKEQAQDLELSFTRIALYQARTLILISPELKNRFGSELADDIHRCIYMCKKDILASSLNHLDKLIILAALLNLPITATITQMIRRR